MIDSLHKQNCTKKWPFRLIQSKYWMSLKVMDRWVKKTTVMQRALRQLREERSNWMPSKRGYNRTWMSCLLNNCPNIYSITYMRLLLLSRKMAGWLRNTRMSKSMFRDWRRRSSKRRSLKSSLRNSGQKNIETVVVKLDLPKSKTVKMETRMTQIHYLNSIKTYNQTVHSPLNLL